MLSLAGYLVWAHLGTRRYTPLEIKTTIYISDTIYDIGLGLGKARHDTSQVEFER
jgi:hypothetical protein